MLNIMLKKPLRRLFAMYDVIIDRIAKLHPATNRWQYVLKHVVAAGRPLRLEELTINIAVIEGLQ